MLQDVRAVIKGMQCCRKQAPLEKQGRTLGFLCLPREHYCPHCAWSVHPDTQLKAHVIGVAPFWFLGFEASFKRCLWCLP